MAEDKKKTTKKKVTKKKAAKKVARKKIVKKATSKKVTKKPEKRKAAKKVLRKKAAQKKPIKLKADSPELDSFASHAAENVEAIEAAAVSLEASTTASNPKKTDNSPKSAPAESTKVKSTTPKVEKTSARKTEDKTAKEKVTPTAKSKPEYKKPAPVTQPPTHVAASTDGNSFTSKLIIAGLLFVGVGVYLLTIFNDETLSKPTAQSTMVSKTDAITTQKPEPASKPELSQVLENIAESSDTTPATTVKQEAGIEFRPLTADKSEQGSRRPELLEEKSLEQALNEEASKQPIAKIGTQQVSETQEKALFPPPPTPDFLQKTSIKPLPENQMKMIKDIFAPELK